MNKTEKDLLDWVVGFKIKHNRMPKRLPAPLTNYKLVDAVRVQSSADFDDCLLELMYRQGKKVIEIKVLANIKMPEMTLDWIPMLVESWTIK